MHLLIVFICIIKNNIAIEDSTYLLIDTREKLEMFMSLINPKWKLSIKNQ